MKILYFGKHLSFKELLLLGASAFIGLASCNKTLDVPSTQVSGEQHHWETLDDARSGLIGTYGLLRAALANENSYWLWGDLRNGDFTSFSSPDLESVIQGDLNASYPLIKELTDWRRFYAVINACNSFIENSEKVLADRRYTEVNHRVDMAQVRTIRAFTYFLMARIWGDVPLILNTPGSDFKEIKRTSQDVVLDFAENEIREVAPVLPYKYGTDDPQLQGNYYGFENGRFVNTLFSKLAAYAVLAHISAWRGHYLDVATYTKFVLDNREEEGLTYSSTEDLVASDGLFDNRQLNQLIGFNFVLGHGEGTTTGHIEDLTLAAPFISRTNPQIFVSKDSITNIFPPVEGNDERFGIDTISGLPRTAYFSNFNGEIPIFSKIKVVEGGVSNNTFSKYNSVLVFTRLEEISLLRAEALAVLKDPEAFSLLNVVRKERGLREVENNESTDILKKIFDERRRELMGEGWRWWDQVRYHKIKRTNPEFNDLIDQGGIYWPISQNVLNRNSEISQNTYWADK